MTNRRKEEASIKNLRAFSEILNDVVHRWETIPFHNSDYGIDVARRLHDGLVKLCKYPKLR